MGEKERAVKTAVSRWVATYSQSSLDALLEAIEAAEKNGYSMEEIQKWISNGR